MLETMMIAAEAPTNLWAFLAVIATPILGGVAFAGRWLFKRLDAAETSKDELYAKIINDVLPALSSSTDLSKQLLETLQKIEAIYPDLVEQLNTVIAKQEELRRQELALARKGRSGN